LEKLTSKSIVARGVSLSKTMAHGRVVNWQDSFFDNPDQVKGKIVYHQGGLPLYKAAFIVESKALALLIGEGNRNYHPLILATEAGIPTIAGIGRHDLEGCYVTVAADKGIVYEGQHLTASIPRRKKVQRRPKRPKYPVYVNVGYPEAFKEAAESGADGVGLIRTEFSAVRAIALNLQTLSSDGKTILQMVQENNEADAIYAMADDKKLAPILKKAFREVIESALDEFGDCEIFVRTLDIARSHNDPMGNRGIRRDVASGGNTIRLLGQAISEVLNNHDGGINIGVILPLVSHYSQIQFAVKALFDNGLSLRDENASKRKENDISFGWEVEQPAASQNNLLWMLAYEQEFKQPPHVIGIGTNDLTQFTIALGRDVASEESDPRYKTYLETLYDERDFSVIRQIVEVAGLCRERGTQVFLLGQIGGDPIIASLMFTLGVTPSVGTSRVGTVRDLALNFSKSEPKQAVTQYIQDVLNKYPPETHDVLQSELNRFFAEHIEGS